MGFHFLLPLLLTTAAVSMAQLQWRGYLQNYTESKNYCVKQLNIQSRPSTVEEMRLKCYSRCIFWRMQAITNADQFKLSIYPPKLHSIMGHCDRQDMNEDGCVRAEQYANCLNETLLERLQTYSFECSEETNTSAFIESLDDLTGSKFRDKKFNCFRRCLLMKAGILNIFNEFQSDYFNKLFSYNVTNIFAKCYQGNMQENVCQRTISRSRCAWDALYLKDKYLKKFFP